MKSIILAAGSGSRLGGLYSNSPKCLVDIGGRRLIDRQIEVLNTCSINEIAIATGFCSEQLEKYGQKQIHNSKFSNTNMVFSLSLAIEYLRGSGGVISYGDILYSPQSLKSLLTTSADIAILSDSNWSEYWKERTPNPIDDLETFAFDSSNIMKLLGSRPSSLSEIMGQYIGVVKLSPIGVEIVIDLLDKATAGADINRKSLTDAYMTDLLMELITHGSNIKAIPFNDPWIEIDTHNDLSTSITDWRAKLIEQQCTSGFDSRIATEKSNV